MKQLLIGSIENQEGRALLYPAKPTPADTILDYRVIASLPDAARLKIGDTIEYEPDGANFGWFSRILPDKTTFTTSNPDGEYIL